jgi:hypothetical protein
VYSGANGAVLHALKGGDTFGSGGLIGDLDGDGKADFLVGARLDDSGASNAGIALRVLWRRRLAPAHDDLDRVAKRQLRRGCDRGSAISTAMAASSSWWAPRAPRPAAKARCSC